MTASANFTANGFATPPELAVAGGATVTLALTSVSGVRTVVWTIEGNSSHTLVNPVITPAGSPLGATATFVMPAGTGQGYLVQCVVNGGNDDEGTYQSQLTKRAIVGVVDASGTVPFCAGETTERSATYGYTERLNAIAGVAGSSGIADHSVTFVKEQQIGVGLVGNDTGTADQKLITLGSGLAFVAGALAVTSVAISSLAAIASVTFLGNITGGSAAPVALTATQVTANLNVATTTLKGLVPAPGTATGKFLNDSLAWATAAGTFTNPVNVTDDGKIGYANAGAIAWASAIKTDGTYLAFGGVNPATLTIGSNRYAHATHITAGLGSDGTTNYDLVQWGVGTNNKLQLGSSAVAVTELQGKQLKVTASAQAGGALTPTIALTGGAHTNLTLSTEIIDVLVDLAQTKQWATGALATQRGLRVTAPTLAFVGASVVATAATVAISGAPAAGTNATLTQSVALWLEAGGIAYGSSAALTGLNRYAHNSLAMVGRSSTSTDVNLVTWGVTTDQLALGADGAASILMSATTSLSVRLGAAATWDFSTTQLDCHSHNIVNLLGINGTRVANGVLGTSLTDADQTLSIDGGSVYEQITALTANRTKKLSNTGTGLADKHVISIRRYTTDANTLTIADEAGFQLYQFAAGAKGQADFRYNSGTSKFEHIGHIPLS